MVRLFVDSHELHVKLAKFIVFLVAVFFEFSNL